MAVVFISYSRQDRDIAEKLVLRLRKAMPENVEIRLDEAVDGELASATRDAYRLPYVGKRLRDANAVVPILTRSYAESDPCWLELSAALMMEKVVPISLDPGLSPAGISSMVGGKPVAAIAPSWFNKEPGEIEAAETAKFEAFAGKLNAESRAHSPFGEWQPAEPRDVRSLVKSLYGALQPRAFRRSGLVWSPGSLSGVQKQRFFAAIDSIAIATGEGVWDIARRKALKAMAAEPDQPRIRAEALLGLIGELTEPTDGSPPVTAAEPWEFVGDFALPIDRDISRFAYVRAGKIPNELRKMFQVLRPGRSKRRAMFAFGALLGGVVGIALAYGGQLLFGQPGARIGPPPSPEKSPASSTGSAIQLTADPITPQPPPAEKTQQPTAAVSVSPSLTSPLPAMSAESGPQAPVSSMAAPSQPFFSVDARGLEASVRAEILRRNIEPRAWQEIYGQVIALNITTLCSPERWKSAEQIGRKPLDLISDTTKLTWPTETDFVKPSPLQECPVYRIPT